MDLDKDTEEIVCVHCGGISRPLLRNTKTVQFPTITTQLLVSEYVLYGTCKCVYVVYVHVCMSVRSIHVC